MRRPELDYRALCARIGAPPAGHPIVDDVVAERIEIAVKYEGYITRQAGEAERFRQLEEQLLPIGEEAIDYERLPGLSREAREKLCRIRPRSIGQAARISGMTPAAVSILLVHTLKQKRSTWTDVNRRLGE